MERSLRVLHHGNQKIWLFFFKKVRNFTFDEELKSPLLRQYQSYSRNWYINGKVFTSTTPWKPKNLNFFKSSKFEFWLLTKSWNHLSFVNISPILIIDMSMEWSSRVLHHGNYYTIWNFFKKFEIEFDLYFDLCWRAEINIQVGLNMHLYVDIGYASSSLWGSTSSYISNHHYDVNQVIFCRNVSYNTCYILPIVDTNKRILFFFL